MGMLLAASLAVPALAQSETPKADVFGGYAYTNLDGQNVLDRQGAHGFGLSVTGNLNRYLGLTGEVSTGWGKVRQTIPGTGINVNLDVDYNTQTYLFGPRLHMRSEKVTVFGHALFGAARIGADLPSIPGLDLSFSETKFAMGYGGGVDYNINDKFAIRAFQADYVPIRADGDWSHNFRNMTGVVFRFGN
jgi:opacity protein-like surface antigen